VHANGSGTERVSDGCCDLVASLRFTVVHVHGDVAEIRTRSGRDGTLTLRGGVFTESLTGSTYCKPGVNRCGA